jgi:antitoxin ParD1/3/4
MKEYDKFILNKCGNPFMSTLTRRTVTLSKVQSDFIDDRIARGDFVSASEVVRAGLTALSQREAEVAHWLAHDVAKTFDRSTQHPDDYVELDAAFATIRAAKSDRSAAA